ATVLPRRAGYPSPSRALAQSLGEEAGLASCVQVCEQDRDCFPDDPAPVDGESVGPQRQPCPLQFNQLGAGHVNGDLLWVAFPAARLSFTFYRRTWRRRPQQLCDSWQAYPARPGPAGTP